MDILAIVATGARSVVDGPQCHQLTAHLATFNPEFARAGGQFEPSRTRAAGIEIEHSVATLLSGNVTMAADHNREARSFRIEI
jgi:hypothetical protein